MMDHWQEVGEHEFCRDFGGVTLTITKLEIPGRRALAALRLVAPITPSVRLSLS